MHTGDFEPCSFTISICHPHSLSLLAPATGPNQRAEEQQHTTLLKIDTNHNGERTSRVGRTPEL